MWMLQILKHWHYLPASLNLLSSRQATFRIYASNLTGASKLVPLISFM